MDNKFAAIIATVLLTLPSASLAADTERHRSKQMRGTLEQDVVRITSEIERARESGQISRDQSLKLKRQEEKFIMKIDDLQDDNRGNIKPRNARLIDRHLNSIEGNLKSMETRP